MYRPNNPTIPSALMTLGTQMSGILMCSSSNNNNQEICDTVDHKKLSMISNYAGWVYVCTMWATCITQLTFLWKKHLACVCSMNGRYLQIFWIYKLAYEHFDVDFGVLFPHFFSWSTPQIFLILIQVKLGCSARWVQKSMCSVFVYQTKYIACENNGVFCDRQWKFDTEWFAIINCISMQGFCHKF